MWVQYGLLIKRKLKCTVLTENNMKCQACAIIQFSLEHKALHDMKPCWSMLTVFHTATNTSDLLTNMIKGYAVRFHYQITVNYKAVQCVWVTGGFHNPSPHIYKVWSICKDTFCIFHNLKLNEYINNFDCWIYIIYTEWIIELFHCSSPLPAGRFCATCVKFAIFLTSTFFGCQVSA